MVDEAQLIRKFQKELSAGLASLVLLSVLEHSREPMYGYQIARLLEAYNQEGPLMKQGALYPVLHSLEDSGLLESSVEPSVSGPPRRYYRITEAGGEILVSWRGIWDQMRAFVDHAVRGG